jgi:toxin ParE1/3/4
VKIRWSTPARLQLRRQSQYIAVDRPIVARLIATRVQDAVNRLAVFPLQGRPGRVIDTRELVVPRTPFTVAYRVTGETVEVIAVVHQAQQWPERFE